MRKMKRAFRVGLFAAISVLGFVVLNGVIAKHRKISSTKGFRSALNRSDLSVALFYDLEKKAPKHIKSKIKGAMLAMSRASKHFKYVEVDFMSVNTARRGLFDLIEMYSLSRPEPNNPTVVLFKGGKQIVTARGFLSKTGLVELVEKHFSKEIKNITEEKDSRRRRRLERARIRAAEWGSYWGPYYGSSWGWPHYGHGWGWPYRYGYGGGFGFRFGGGRRFGGGCRGRRCR